jgi:flagellar hook-associated protein 2
MAIISVGGLATGLDTNRIVDQLVALERRRSVGLLEAARVEARARETALEGLGGKLLALRAAVERLRAPGGVLVARATSSDTAVLGAVAGAGAAPGATTITVTSLATAAIAVAGSGTASADATVAAGAGTFAFRVGDGDVQAVAIDAGTTLAGLAEAINDLDAGVGASVVNVGTAAAPDFRLRLAGEATGAARALTIVADDTALGVAVTEQAADAVFTVSGFTTPLARERNTFDDVIPGVTLELRAAGGPVTVSVATDGAAAAERVRAVVDAYNDLVRFVAAESTVTQDTAAADRTVRAGPLAFDRTARGVLDALRGLVSTRVEDLDGAYTALAQLGIATERDGTLRFDGAALEAALAADSGAVAALFAGAGATDGVADRLADYLAGVTQAGGLVANGSAGVAEQIRTLEDRIAAGERNLDQFERNLRATFASLEVLVSTLQAQGAFLLSALGRNG